MVRPVFHQCVKAAGEESRGLSFNLARLPAPHPQDPLKTSNDWTVLLGQIAQRKILLDNLSYFGKLSSSIRQNIIIAL